MAARAIVYSDPPEMHCVLLGRSATRDLCQGYTCKSSFLVAVVAVAMVIVEMFAAVLVISRLLAVVVFVFVVAVVGVVVLTAIVVAIEVYIVGMVKTTAVVFV